MSKPLLFLGFLLPTSKLILITIGIFTDSNFSHITLYIINNIMYLHNLCDNYFLQFFIYLYLWLWVRQRGFMFFSLALRQL